MDEFFGSAARLAAAERPAGKSFSLTPEVVLMRTSGEPPDFNCAPPAAGKSMDVVLPAIYKLPFESDDAAVTVLNPEPLTVFTH